MREATTTKLRGGACTYCHVAYAWPARKDSPLGEARCPTCGGRLLKVGGVERYRRFPVVKCSAWFRSDEREFASGAVEYAGPFDPPSYWYWFPFAGGRAGRKKWAGRRLDPALWMKEAEG